MPGKEKGQLKTKELCDTQSAAEGRVNTEDSLFEAHCPGHREGAVSSSFSMQCYTHTAWMQTPCASRSIELTCHKLSNSEGFPPDKPKASPNASST